MQNFKIAIRVFCICFVSIGVIYQLIVTILGLTFFHHKANGSLLAANKKIVGSELIGQPFQSAKYFSGRIPDIINGIGTLQAHPSNLSIKSTEFLEREKNLKAFAKQLYNDDKIPIEFITGSGSGLDPHISKNTAYYQIESVAKARNVSSIRIKNLVDNSIESPQFFILGQDKINVLKLNIALDKQFGKNNANNK